MLCSPLFQAMYYIIYIEPQIFENIRLHKLNDVELKMFILYNIIIYSMVIHIKNDKIIFMILPKLL